MRNLTDTSKGFLKEEEMNGKTMTAEQMNELFSETRKLIQTNKQKVSLLIKWVDKEYSFVDELKSIVNNGR